MQHACNQQQCAQGSSCVSLEIIGRKLGVSARVQKGGIGYETCTPRDSNPGSTLIAYSRVAKRRTCSDQPPGSPVSIYAGSYPADSVTILLPLKLRLLGSMGNDTAIVLRNLTETSGVLNNRSVPNARFMGGRVLIGEKAQVPVNIVVYSCASLGYTS